MDYFGRVLSRVLFLSLLMAISAADAWAVHPDGPITFFWTGTGNDHMGGIPTGNGATGAWENWQRSSFFPDDFNFPPQDGDTLDISNVALGQPEIRHTITISDLSLHVGVLFDLNADFSGGNLEVDAVEIANLTAGGIYYSSDFSGTSIQADDFNIDTVGMPITFSGSTLSAPDLRITGTDQIPSLPLVGGQARVNVVAGSSLEFFTLNVGRDHYNTTPILNPFVLNVDASTLTGLGMDVSGGELSQRTARVQLANESQATLEQFVVVGSAAKGELDVSGSSNLTVTSGYLNIGDLAQGSLHVSQNAEVHTSDFNVGVVAQGDVAADSDGKIYSTAAYVGVFPSHDGTVNLEGGALWQTTDLQLGVGGTGYVYVRDDGTLKIDHEAVLGVQSGGRGVLNLIGAQAHLELAPTATLTIGKNGTGELNISEGASFSSEGNVTLGELDGSQGIVTVDGSGSHWTVGNNLVIGDRAVGSLTLSDGASVDVSGTMSIGREQGSEGTLTLDGEDVRITSSNNLLLSGLGKGTVELKNGAELTLQQVLIGQSAAPDAEGDLMVDGAGSSLTSNGDFVLGDASKGVFHITDAGSVTTNGNVVLSQDEGSDSETMIQSADDPASWTVNGDVMVGAKGISRVFVQDNGQLTVNGDLSLGADSQSEGMIDIHGQLANVSGMKLRVGKVGTGEIDVHEGATLFAESATISSMQTPDQPARHAIVNVYDEGSTFETQHDLVIGAEAQQRGQLTVGPQGEVITGGKVVIGRDAGSVGEATINASPTTDETRAKWSVAGNLTVGDGGMGNLDVLYGGRVVASGAASIEIGKQANADGTVNVRAEAGDPQSQLTHPGNLKVGVAGSGTLLLGPNALVHTSGDAAIGEMTGSHGIVDVDGTNAQWIIDGKLTFGQGITPGLTVRDHARLTVAKDLTAEEGGGKASIQVLDGAHVTTGEVNLQSQSDIVVSGTGTIWSATNWNANEDQPASLKVLDGAILGIDVNSEYNLVNITFGGANSNVTISGSADHPASLQVGYLHSVDVSGKMRIGDGGEFYTPGRLVVNETGELNIEGSSHFEVNGVLVRNVMTLNGVNEYITTSGTQILGSHVTVNNSRDLGAGFEVSEDFEQSVGELTISGQTITGPVVAGKVGKGLVSVDAGANWTVGNDTVGGLIQLGGTDAFGGHGIGTLVLGAGSTVHVLGDFIVSKDSTWSGKGTIIANNFTNAGEGKPGQSPGAITIDANFVQTDDGLLELELAGLDPSQHDVLNIIGTAQIDGSVLLKFIDGFAPAAGDQFSLITASDLTATPDVFVRNLKSGWQYSVSQQGGTWMVTSLSDGVFVTPGDFNQDGSVNAADYTVWRNSLGSVGLGLAADADDDGIIGPEDYDVWKTNFGTGSGSGSAMFSNEALSPAVPEPAAAWLLVCGVLVAGFRRVGARVKTRH